LDKAPEAFRTISEVAEELDLPQHVLRFWETRFAQIKPLKRGGGRRYYRPEDVALLRGIRHLLYGQGYTIRGVQRILRERGVRFVQTVWQEGAEQPAAESAAEEPSAEHVNEDGEPTDSADEDRRGLFAFLRRTGGEPLAPDHPQPMEQEAGVAAVTPAAGDADGAALQARLEALLAELAACRAALEAALREDS
jgi:DNA-binding transcriptional MerR regulator